MRDLGGDGLNTGLTFHCKALGFKALNPKPSTLNPKQPSALNPKPSTLNPKTLNPQP